MSLILPTVSPALSHHHCPPDDIACLLHRLPPRQVKMWVVPVSSSTKITTSASTTKATIPTTCDGHSSKKPGINCSSVSARQRRFGHCQLIVYKSAQWGNTTNKAAHDLRLLGELPYDESSGRGIQSLSAPACRRTPSTGTLGVPRPCDGRESEDKPIFLSIGYSACHWCHVMERESFTDHRDGGVPQRPLRQHQGRPRREARSRRHLHAGRHGADRARRLAAQRLARLPRASRSTAEPTSRRPRA